MCAGGGDGESSGVQTVQIHLPKFLQVYVSVENIETAR